jgi:hypothetical protein
MTLELQANVGSSVRRPPPAKCGHSVHRLVRDIVDLDIEQSDPVRSAIEKEVGLKPVSLVVRESHARHRGRDAEVRAATGQSSSPYA